MNEEQTISSSCQQDIGSNGRKEDIICWYELLILHIHLSTADILPTIIMVFVVVMFPSNSVQIINTKSGQILQLIWSDFTVTKIWWDSASPDFTIPHFLVQ